MVRNNGGLLFHSPLKRRDFIPHQGRKYQIIKFLRATDTVEKGVIYRARDIRTKDVVNITLPYDIQPHPEEEEGEDNFFQILDLNEEDKEVTLKSFLTGVERRMKVRWDEDVDVIKDGLMEEYKDMLCTLKEVMGKEMIGDFRFMAKDPPMMKMPDEMLDTIFSKLTPEDRLTCRLVTKRWAAILPITKFVKCIELCIDPDAGFTPIRAVFRRLDTPNYPIVENHVRERMRGEGTRTRSNMREAEDEALFVYKNPEVRLKDLRPLIITFLLENVDYLTITSKSRIEHLLETLSQHCIKLKGFSLKDGVEDVEAADSNWTFAKKIIAANSGHLKSLIVTTSLRDFDLSSPIGDCTSLQDLDIKLSQRPSVLTNWESVPPSIVILSIGGFTFTKSQFLWIIRNCPHLEYLDLEVPHNHSDNDGGNMDEDEVDKITILQMLNALPSLKRVTLILGPPIDNLMHICKKACQLRNYALARFHCSMRLRRMYPNPEGFELLEFEDRKVREGR